MLAKYIGQKGADNLKQFRYSGVNISILYNAVLSPLAQFIVDKLPTWLAPNFITLIGLFFIIQAFILNMAFNPYFDQTVPNWVCIYTALCIFLYQTLDNCDGKQVARRTNSATAMGMLFDHGSDSLVQWILSLTIASILRVELGYIHFFALLIIGNISFFFGVYQQRHTGVFKLDKINAVDEAIQIGIPGVILVALLTGFVGPDFWVTTIPGIGLQWNHFILLFTLLANLVTIARFAIPAIIVIRSPLKIIQSLGLPITLITAYLIIGLGSPTKIIFQVGHLYVMSFGFQWSKMINMMQVCIVTKEVHILMIVYLQNFTQLRISWFAVIGINVINVLTSFFTSDGQCLFDEIKLVYITLIYSFLTYIHTAISLMIQMSEILEINIFKLKKIQTE